MLDDVEKRISAITDNTADEMVKAGVQRVNLEIEPTRFLIEITPEDLEMPDEQLGEAVQCIARSQAESYGNRTVYLRRKLYARLKLTDGDRSVRDESAQALVDAGDDWAILVQKTVNAMSLSARVRELECDEQGDPIIPESIKKAILVDSRVEVGVLKR